MFRQINVHESDRDFQRIIWRDPASQTLQTYTLNTITYGTHSAPFLANACLLQLEDDGFKFPLTSKVISQNTCVDDVLSGAFSIQEVQAKVLQFSKLFDSGCFPLRKWITSHSSLLHHIPTEHQTRVTSRTIKGNSMFRTLGLSWNQHSDSFCFQLNLKASTNKVTKRSLLSSLFQLFDPLDTLHMEWHDYMAELQQVSDIHVPRWLGINDSVTSIELHGFSDASLLALGAVVYIKVNYASAPSSVNIVASKTKVAPIPKVSTTENTTGTKVTIPRLELTASVLLVKLIKPLQELLSVPSTSVHLWTDSSITFFWIQGIPSRWKEFVSNRTSYIQETLPFAHWHHVAGDQNPADVASRGSTPRQLALHPLWWKGPTWLTSPCTAWPQSNCTVTPNCELEKRTSSDTTKLVLITRARPPPAIEELFLRYSSVTSLLRTVSWIRRFIKNCKNRLTAKEIDSNKFLSVYELETTRRSLDLLVQKAYFSNEIQTIETSGRLSNTHPFLQLSPYIDKTGLLRIGGRLSNALLSNDAQHPILLPSDSYYCKLILRDIHEKTLHGGAQIMLATLRQQYWIIGGRLPVRQFLKKCVECTRQKGTPLTQLMGQLPKSRVSPNRPFLKTGVDYAGPFIIKSRTGRNVSTYKGYLVVFICLSTSAVHLDMVTSYSTQGFLSAFKRFTARRGHCTDLYSDCGTNFIGADNELKKLFTGHLKEFETLRNDLSNTSTTWHFNPPAAPHMGGKWEAAVKSAKFHIKRIVKNYLLTYEEWSTLLTQIEAILNSRPIAPLSDDPDDLTPLTPGHFLIGCALNVIPEPNLLSVSEKYLSRYQLHRRFLDQFWTRWSKEYLQKYLIRNKWKQVMDNIKVGDLVLLVDERYPPAKWPLGRILHLHPGKNDDYTRVVTVKTSTSVLTRPISKLCHLPISDSYIDSLHSPRPGEC